MKKKMEVRVYLNVAKTVAINLGNIVLAKNGFFHNTHSSPESWRTLGVYIVHISCKECN